VKNFVFISPNFPATYWRFCAELRKNGLRVLGIGDCPYDELSPQLRDSLDEYYKVSSLENYDEVFRGVAFLTFKHGKIDYLESNNEYWLERDAALRTAFNITGLKTPDMEHIKYKSAMKAYYAKAGIPTARYHLVKDFDAAKAFAAEVGYPVVVKPDNGVGAGSTYRLRADSELEYFFATKDPSVQFVMEEFVDGEVRTYDAIVDSRGEPILETGNVTPQSLMDVMNEADNAFFYIVKDLSDRMRELGRKTVKAFGITSRYVHLEFFVLKRDQAGLGKQGDILGLEVNMRPPGGICPDMENFANEVDVYKIWADMIAFDRTDVPLDRPHHFCGFCGRRDGKQFKLTHEQIVERLGGKLKLAERVPDVMAGIMGNQMYVGIYETEAEMFEAFRMILE